MAAYHQGETAVQRRAGLADQAEFSLGGIGDTIPGIAAAFLAEQPMIVLGGADSAGRIWATQLTGRPGFLRADTPRVLTIATLPAPHDPLADLLSGAATAGAPFPLGMIAMEPATRRRMRLNGRAVRDGDGLRVELDQVIANCPKYIQKRDHRFADADDGTDGDDGPGGPAVTDGTALDEAQQRAVRAADTFFIATASDRGDTDASHRGGNPGFVEVLSPTLLRWPDYTGNAMFLTLGNLALNPAAGIVLPLWRSGSSLHLSGTARTLWDPEETARVPGAQRLVEFSVEAVREVTAASPLRWSAPAYSRFNPPVR
ncbi:pyridoxamine 5'-phosphate oxidase family protein [Streptomyces sp. NPDC004609]|uniref:pyridoxamine 5'-phosphate oxidase family protein n=1 Tax=Streptomyces sp. NPDC004609 TaxID=3364704 RepID=UPI0036839FDF